MERVSQIILELMDKGVVSPRQASALMRCIGEGDLMDEKLSIIERLRTRAVSCDETIELLAGLTGEEDLAEKTLAEETFWKKLRR